MNLAINWTVDAQLIDGWSTPNVYGLLFVTGLALGFVVVKRMFKAENISEAWLDKLLMYMVLSTIIGARLGHCLFYDPAYYLSNPLEILKVWEGGLASHGGAIAIIIALYIYSKKVSKKHVFWILDKVVAPVAVAGIFIRLGNLVNHEIVGVPSDVSWAFIFNNESRDLMIDGKHVPRHPAQLYEAIAYFFIAIFLLYVYWKTTAKEKLGMMFSLFLISIFTARFLIEFVKVGQAERDAGLILNTGQWLSIPFVLVGVIVLIWTLKNSKNMKPTD